MISIKELLEAEVCLLVTCLPHDLADCRHWRLMFVTGICTIS